MVLAEAKEETVDAVAYDHVVAVVDVQKSKKKSELSSPSLASF